MAQMKFRRTPQSRLFFEAQDYKSEFRKATE